MNQDKNPNILLIFTDQFRWDCISEIGNKEVLTPNLDRLCREGTNFTRAYSPSPVCVPARQCKFWGQYPGKIGLNDNKEGFTPNQKNFMEILSDNGYYCHGIGKMHFSNTPTELNGFNSRERQEEIMGDAKTDEYLKYLLDKGYDRVFDIHGQRSEMYYIPQVSPIPQQDHPTNWMGERSVEFIRNHDSKKPFFLMSSFVHPHPPFSPPAPWNKMYRVPDISDAFVPEDYEELLVYINHVQNRYKFRSNGIDKNLIKTIRAHYFACVSFLDYQVGKVLDELERKGILDDTMIIFTSDHGEMLGDYNSFGKRCMLDSAAKIPMVVRYPSKIDKNTETASPASLVDIYPTVLDVAGISRDNLDLDGESLLKIASGESNRKNVFSQFSEGATGLYMTADKNTKIIYSAADDKTLYFDNRLNLSEEKNLWGVDSFKPFAEKIKSTLIKHLAQNVPDAIQGNDFRKYPTRSVPADQNEGLLYQDHHWCKDIEPIMPEGYRIILKR